MWALYTVAGSAVGTIDKSQNGAVERRGGGARAVVKA